MGKDKLIIPDNVKIFADSSEKKYLKKAKKTSFMYDKKEAIYTFYADLIDQLPDTIEWLIYRTHINDPKVKEVKKDCHDKIGNPTFVKVLTNELKTGNSVKNYKLLPIIIGELLEEADKDNKRRDAEALENGIKDVKYRDVSDLVELSKLCMKKSAKKLKSACGNLIDDDMIFDILTAFPHNSLVTMGNHYQYYYYKILLETLYEISKTKKVPIMNILKGLLRDEDVIEGFVFYALLEKKDKYNTLSDPQRILWNEITEISVAFLEQRLQTKDCKEFLVSYAKRRRTEDRQNRDGYRRIQLSALSESDYPNIKKAVNQVMDKNDSLKKYL